MFFTGVRELRLNTSEILKKTDQGEQVLITYRGKPRAIIQGITEDDLEDFILLNHPQFKARLEQSLKQALEGQVTNLDELIAQTKEEIGQSHHQTHQED